MRRFLSLLLLLPLGCSAFAQVAEAVPAPAVGTLNALRQMAGGAAVIFAGEVIAIRRQMASADDLVPELVEIDFRVQEAVRGCQANTRYTLREWGGLWTGGDRYEVGQRRMMLLHAPAAGGFSSPVLGLDGAIPVTAGSVDLRWVQRHGMQVAAPLTEQPATQPIPISPPKPHPVLKLPGRTVETTVQENSFAGPSPGYVRTSVSRQDTATLNEVLATLRGVEGAVHAR